MTADICTRYTAPVIDPETGEVSRVPRYRWHNETTGKSYPFRCKSWRCDSCRKILVKKLRYRIGAWGEYYKLTRFWTLTLDPDKLTDGELRKYGYPDVSWATAAGRYLSATWNKFRTMLRRKYPRLKYIVIRELHKNLRVLHLHILVSDYIPWEWMKSKWTRYGGGPVVWVKYVDVHRVSAYLAPYFTKMGSIEASAFPEHIRRYATDRSIKLAYTPQQWLNRPRRADECAYIDVPDDPRKRGGCAKCPHKRTCKIRPPGDTYVLYDCGHPVSETRVPIVWPQTYGDWSRRRIRRIIDRMYRKWDNWQWDTRWKR